MNNLDKDYAVYFCMVYVLIFGKAFAVIKSLKS